MLRRLSNETGIGVIRTPDVRACACVHDSTETGRALVLFCDVVANFTIRSEERARPAWARPRQQQQPATGLMSGICVLVFLSLWYAEHAAEMRRCASGIRQCPRNQITLAVRAFIFIGCWRSGDAGVRWEYVYDARIETNARRLENWDIELNRHDAAWTRADVE